MAGPQRWTRPLSSARCIAATTSTGRLRHTVCRLVVTAMLAATLVLTPTLQPVPPASAATTSDWATVVAGKFRTCGIHDDGTVQCWGGWTPNLVPPGTWAQLSLGETHACGIRTDGVAQCWDLNAFGQANLPAGPWTQIVAGGRHSCGLHPDGTAECWGTEESGTAPVPSGPWQQLSAGAAHTCGVRLDGTGACWGANSLGQSNAPGGTWRAIVAGFYHSCGLRLDGSAECWGSTVGTVGVVPNQWTQLSAGRGFTCGVHPDGSAACWGSTELEAVPPGTWRQVSSGEKHACGVRTDGTIACWGTNTTSATDVPSDRPWVRLAGSLSRVCGIHDDGEAQCIGSSSPGGNDTPPGPWSQLAVGVAHSCGLHPDGTGECWGYDTNGQTAIPSGTWTHLAVGYTHSCGLRPDASVECWGANNLGQSAPPPGPWTQIDSQFDHTCGLHPDGSVECWGANNDGQAAEPAGPWSSISVGVHHTCGLRSSGAAMCWGSDADGQSSPRAGLWIAIDAGTSHTCGLRADGTAECWGFVNGMGPDGPWAQVEAGNRVTCGLRLDATHACWNGIDPPSSELPDLLFPSLGSITGSVIESGTGLPLGGLQVSLVEDIASWRPDLVAARTTTAPDGSFAFGNVSPRRYRLRVADPSGVFAHTWWQQVTDDRVGSVVTVPVDGFGNIGTASADLSVERALPVACDRAPFTDVAPSHPFCPGIQWVGHRGVLRGWPDGTFRPGNELTRDVLAVALYRMAGQPSGADPTCAAAPTTDVPVTHPFCGEIAWARGNGIMGGYAGPTFRPTEAVTRDMIIVALYRLVRRPAGHSPHCRAAPFADVDVTHPFCGQLAWAKSVGLVTGYADGNYRSTSPVTRQAAATLLHRANTFELCMICI